MSKKFYIIITIVLVLFLGGLLGYYFLIRTNGPAGQTGTGGGIFSFFPFGNGGSNTGTQPTSTTTTPIVTTQVNPLNNPAKKLRELSAEPVSGAGVLDVKIGTSTKSTLKGTVVNYVEKATGFIFSVDLFDANQNRISNTTIPLSYDAMWGNNNNSFVARYLKSDDQTVDTYALTLKIPSAKGVSPAGTPATTTISAVALPTNITDVQVLGGNIFYLQQTAGDGSSGYISNFSGTTKKQIWVSPIRDFNSQYVNANTVTLTTKPAQNIGGFLYFVNTTSGNVRKVLGNVPGLSALVSPDGTKVLYLGNSANAQMYLYTISPASGVSIAPATFPEKCVWSKLNANIVYCAVPEGQLDGSSLTAWWQGYVSLSDDIWKYDLKNNTAIIIENLSTDAGVNIDVVKPILSDDEQYLVFVNKSDNSLWSLDLTK